VIVDALLEISFWSVVLAVCIVALYFMGGAVCP